MVVTCTPLSPFASPPPHPLIVLLNATNLDDGTDYLVSLLAHEELIGRGDRSRCLQSLPRHHPYRSVANKPRPSTSRAESSPLSSPDPSDSEDDEPNPSPRGKIPCRIAFSTPGPVSDKLRVPRPRGAARTPLLQLVKWEQVQLDAMKARFLVTFIRCPFYRLPLHRKVSKFI